MAVSNNAEFHVALTIRCRWINYLSLIGFGPSTQFFSFLCVVSIIFHHFSLLFLSIIHEGIQCSFERLNDSCCHVTSPLVGAVWGTRKRKRAEYQWTVKLISFKYERQSSSGQINNFLMSFFMAFQCGLKIS